jgi:hypothetical protein
VALINNSITSENRLPYVTSPLNLSLVIYNGYDISVNALPSSIIGISNNILTSPRLFDTSDNINYNYNIIPLTSQLVNGLIGLSFEMYRTGFFGTFALRNKTANTIIEYSYNYISISGSIYTRASNNISTFDLIIQNSPPSNSTNNFGQNSTKFAKTTNTNNNGSFRAAIGATQVNGVYYWTGTTTNNQLILLQSPSTSYNLGKVVAIDNAGQYIVSGGFVSYGSAYGGRIWSTTSPYNSTTINYPFLGSSDSFVMSVHISGNGQRVFVGSYSFTKIYAFTHNNLSLTQIGGAITCDVPDYTNTFTTKGFASDNNGDYLITSAYAYFNVQGIIIMYHFTGTTWVQSGSVFYGTAAGDQLGTSIDMNCGSGEWACAGAPNATTPYVKIYKRNTITNAWTEFQTLNGTNGSGFGTSVSFNESGSTLYVTTSNAEIFYYTRLDNNELFTLTLTIPVQQPTSNVVGQWVSTNNSGTQVILVKSSSTAASAYYFKSIEGWGRLNGGNLIIDSISSANRVAYATSPLNLSLVIADGYDISVNALPSAIVGISNNILTSPRLFDTSNNINYNYNIIPLSSYLVNGTIGLSFELYRTGFFGDIVLNNNGSSTIDYFYNYISINSINNSRIAVPLISITNSSPNTRTISGELRLRDASGQITMKITTPSSVSDISYSINGGTINNFEITTISSNKYSTFNILPNVNNLINGTLTINFNFNNNVVPEPPTNLVATIVANSVTITWDEPTITGSSAIISYSIFNHGILDTPNITTRSFTKTNNSYDNRVTYNITIKAINSVGASLPSSPPLQVTLAAQGSPGPPTAVGATVAGNNNSANITWTAPTYTGSGATIQSYRLYDNSILLTPNITATNITVTNSTASSITYSFTISTFNSAGLESFESSPPVSVTLAPPERTGFNGSIKVIGTGFLTSSSDIDIIIYADNTLRFAGSIPDDSYISIGGELGPRLDSPSSIIYIYAEGQGSDTGTNSYALIQDGGSIANITSQPAQTFIVNGASQLFQGYTIGSALNNATLVVSVSTTDDNDNN